MKILNLYAGIGGNRKLWGDDHDITAVEIDEHTADVYKSFYPNDTVVVGDANNYLLENYEKFDFIWSSPPCPTHSRLNTTRVGLGYRPKYIDMTLYQQIVFLDGWFQGKYVVENVIPYYTPLIPGQKCDRHLWWANFKIGNFKPSNKPPHETAKVSDFETFFDIDLSGFNPKGSNTKLKMLRNMVHPETGKYILDRAMEIHEVNNRPQLQLF